MPSYAELQAETWWGREIVTPELRWLGDELCRRTGRPRTAAGDKGDNKHLNGGHRSQEWIKNSRFCTNRTYTVQSGLTAEQARHIAAEDFVPGAWGTAANRALVAQQTRRMWDAAKRGELSGITQVLGTLDGRTPAGLNVFSGSTFTPDSTHLDHWHLTFDRRRLRDGLLMARIADTALGTSGGLIMFCRHGDKGPVVEAMQRLILAAGGALPKYGPDADFGDETAAGLKALVGGDGRTYGPAQYAALQVKLAAKHGTGQPGPAGPQGPPGQPGKTPTRVRLGETEAVVVAAS